MNKILMLPFTLPSSLEIARRLEEMVNDPPTLAIFYSMLAGVGGLETSAFQVDIYLHKVFDDHCEKKFPALDFPKEHYHLMIVTYLQMEFFLSILIDDQSILQEAINTWQNSDFGKNMKEMAMKYGYLSEQPG